MDVYRITDEGKDEYQWFPHSAAENPRLSHTALGLLVQLLADGEKFESVRALTKHYGSGAVEIEEAVEAARELEAEGYLRHGERTEVWAVPFGWEAGAGLVKTADEERGR